MILSVGLVEIHIIVLRIIVLRIVVLRVVQFICSSLVCELFGGWFDHSFGGSSGGGSYWLR